MKKIKRIEDYTVLEIIEKYKEIMGTRINDIILNSFSKEFRREINKVVERKLKEKGVEIFSKEYAEKKNVLLYEILERQIKDIPNLNEDNEFKRRILSVIYVNRPSNMKEKDVRDIKTLVLGREPYRAIKINRDENIFSYEIITADEPKTLNFFISERKKSVIKKSLGEILGMDDLCAVLDSKYPKVLLELVLSKRLVEFLLDEKKFSKEEYDELINKNGTKGVGPEYEEEYRRFVMKYLEENLQLLDIPKLMLNSAARTIIGIKLEKGQKIEGIKLKKYHDEKGEGAVIPGSIMLLQDIYKELEKIIGEKVGYRIINDKGEELILVSKAIIKEFLERCTEDDYLTDDDIKRVHDEILEGIIPEDIKKRQIADLNMQDLIDASKSYDRKEDDETKSKLLVVANELSKYLKEQGLTTNKKLLNLYFGGEINLDFIKNIDMPEITPEEYNQKFKIIYDRILYAYSDEEKEVEKQILSRLAELYKYLETEGRTDIDDLIDKLITAYGEDNGVEVMYDLYNLKMVSIENAVGWIGDNILLKLCEEDRLPPAKVRQLFENGSISIDSIANIVNTLSDTSQKFMLIGSIFSDDKKNWNELVSRCIRIEKGAKEQTEKGIERKNREKPLYTKHVLEAFKRMRKISSIDDEFYYEKNIVDGHVVAHMPTFQYVVIEKPLDRKGNTAYGVATYRISKKYFEENKHRIIENGKIHRKVLYEDYKRQDIAKEDVDRKIHIEETWERDIDEWFGIEPESRWNEDELKYAERKGKTKGKQIGENK